MGSDGVSQGPPFWLKIKRRHLQEILDHLQSAYPLEACGLLAGLSGEVSRVYAVENALQSPTAFEMNPREQLRAMLDIEVRGLEMLAIYHSHPQGPERPSETDVALAYYPEAVQVIVSLKDRRRPVVRAFSIEAGRVKEVKLSLE